MNTSILKAKKDVKFSPQNEKITRNIKISSKDTSEIYFNSEAPYSQTNSPKKKLSLLDL